MRLGGAQNPHSPAICPEGAANLVSRARGYFNGAPRTCRPDGATRCLVGLPLQPLVQCLN